MHGRWEGFRWFHHRFNQAIVVFNRLDKLDHVNAAVFVSIEVLDDGHDVEISEVNTRETRDGLGQFLVSDALRAVCVDFMEHLSDVKILEGVQQCPEGVIVVLMIIIVMFDVVRFIEFLIMFNVVRIVNALIGFVFLIGWKVFILERLLFFSILHSRFRLINRFLIVGHDIGFFLAGVRFLFAVMFQCGLDVVLFRGLRHHWFRSGDEGFSRLVEFLLIQVSVFVFIE